MKFGLYGLKGLMAYPVTTDTETEYKVGAGFPLPEAMDLGADPDVAEGTIYADDKVYFHARNKKGATLTVTVAELPLELKKKVGGGEYDETLKKYTFPEGSVRPTLALRTYTGFVDNSGYRVEYATVCDVLEIEMSGNKVTRGDGVEVNGVNIVMYSRPRKVDGNRTLEYDAAGKAELDAVEADFIKGVGGDTGG